MVKMMEIDRKKFPRDLSPRVERSTETRIRSRGQMFFFKYTLHACKIVFHTCKGIYLKVLIVAVVLKIEGA